MSARLDLNFDYDALEDAIFAGARHAFRQMQRDFKHETFYGFALMSNDHYHDVTLAANSEEGLTRRVVENRKYSQEFRDADEELCKAYLRPVVEDYFFFREWKLMQRYEPFLKKANVLMRDHRERSTSLIEFSDAYSRGPDAGSDAAWDRLIEPFEAEIRERFSNALRRLDQINLFEMTNTRDNVTLGIHVHDSKFSPDGVLADTHRLNPEIVHRKFMADYERHLEAEKVLFGR